MAYGDFKDLAKKTASVKILRDKAFNSAKAQTMMDNKEVFLLWFTNILIKSLKLVVLIIKLNKMRN